MDKRLRWADVYYALDQILDEHDTMSLLTLYGKRYTVVEAVRVPHQIIKIAYTYNMEHITALISLTSVTINRNRVLVCEPEPDDIVPVYDYSVVVLSLYYMAINIYSVRRERVVKGCPSVSSERIHIDEEEYEKHHTDTKYSGTVTPAMDDDLSRLIELSSENGLFSLELNVAEVAKKDELDVATVASTIIRMSDYSDKEFFLNHIRNILTCGFTNIAEDYFSKYYDALPKEADLTTKIATILRDAGVNESKIADTAIALIDTMIDPEAE